MANSAFQFSLKHTVIQNPKKVSLTKWHCIPQRLNSMFFEKYFSKEPVATEEKYLKKSTLAFEVIVHVH